MPKAKSVQVKVLATCKNCAFCHQDDEGSFLCFGSPPQLMLTDDGSEAVRGLPVNPDHPRCACFQPPMND